MKNKGLVLLLAVFLCAGCRTLSEPKEIAQELDYSDETAVSNEKKRIAQFLQEEPVKALWRAKLLGDGQVLQKCIDVILLKLDEAITGKDYFEAHRYYVSLRTIGYTAFSYSQKDIDSLFIADVPGNNIDRSLLPKTVDDCINATVTIWVDRGIAIKNGAGYSDIVLGSGFFIDQRGYIITNQHVIDSMVNPKYEGYSRLYIKLPSDVDTKIPAKVVGYDSTLDLALLKVELEPPFILALGSSSELHIGDKVSAIGTPLGLEGTITSGIISSVDRKLMTLGNVFQLDAAVNSGNSGGPLIDENKRVQAVVFAGMLQYQGLNFAIPVEYLKQELALLYCGGEVNHTWIAASGRTKRTAKLQEGLEVQYVMPGGSAKISGLKDGDVITGLGGAKISSLEEFQFACMQYEPGTLLECRYTDEAGEKSTLVYLDKRPESPLTEIYKSDFVSGSFIPIFGMKLVPSSTLNRKTYTIEKIYRGSTADQLSFSEFDQITVSDVKFDYENKYFFAQLNTKLRKKAFLDMSIVLSASFDSPYYF